MRYLEHEGFKTEIHSLDPYDSNNLNNLAEQLKKDDLFVIPNSRSAYTLNMVPSLKKPLSIGLCRRRW